MPKESSLFPEGYVPTVEHLKRAAEAAEAGKETKLEAELNLQEQYKAQEKILAQTGLLEKLSTGELGIKAINGKEYPFPSYEQIIAERIKNREAELSSKTEQGFTQLLIVPFGMKLDDLIEKYKQVILKHHEQNKLLAAKAKPTDPDEKLELDKETPVWVWDEYKNADINGKLVYHPRQFTPENHQGRTKEQILTEQGAYDILLLEDLSNIPRKDNGKTIGNRPQLEAGQTPEEYLETLKTNPAYQHETGLTPEGWITYAITRLEKTNQVTDDYSGKGLASYQLGAWFPAAGRVPRAGWGRDGRRDCLDGGVPGYSYPNHGARGAVRVS